MTSLQTVLVGATLAIAGAGAFAQTATPRIDQRAAQQERRIDQGVASGELTAREARKLDRQQDRIAATEARAKADGRVTKQERAKLHHQQERAGAAIAHQKHDRQTAKP
jgi:hypothetical protein